MAGATDEIEKFEQARYATWKSSSLPRQQATSEIIISGSWPRWIEFKPRSVTRRIEAFGLQKVEEAKESEAGS